MLLQGSGTKTQLKECSLSLLYMIKTMFESKVCIQWHCFLVHYQLRHSTVFRNRDDENNKEDVINTKYANTRSMSSLPGVICSVT